MRYNEGATRVILAVDNNRGYAADQIEQTMTLQDLMARLEEAIEMFGPDALIVTHDAGNGYGASYGGINTYADTFTEIEGDEDEEEVL